MDILEASIHDFGGGLGTPGKPVYDPNWHQDLHGTPLPREFTNVLRYLERASIAFSFVNQKEIPVETRTILIATCLHACQSLNEALTVFAASRTGKGTDLGKSFKKLPFALLVQDMRNADIHGAPIPVCVEGQTLLSITCKPGSPMKIISNGVAVGVSMHGASPKVSLSPKDQKNGKFDPGSAVSFQCSDGELIVHDFSKNKRFKVVEVLNQYIVKAEEIILNFAHQQNFVLANQDVPSQHPTEQ